MKMRRMGAQHFGSRRRDRHHATTRNTRRWIPSNVSGSSLPTTSPRWRLLIHDPLPPPLALAIDEAIALCCHENGGMVTIRFYQWDHPAISVGRFQEISRVVRIDECRQARIPILRRITGGRAVWHDRELTYSVISPLPSHHFPARLIETVATIGRGLASGLQQLGIPARTVGTPAPAPRVPASARQRRTALAGHSPFCFASTSASEITCHGRKLIGSAQRRWRDRFLQQGSILIEYEPTHLDHWMKIDPGDLHAVTSLSEWLPGASSVAPAQIARQLADAMAAHWDIQLTEGTLTSAEWSLAGQLVRGKYSHPGWIDCRNVQSTVRYQHADAPSPT